MGPRDQLAALLAAYSPRLLDASARGSGWNSVWLLTYGGGGHILKVYGRRRARLREALTHLVQRAGGLTGYTADARRATEERLLRLWREAGVDCPALEPVPGGFPALPAPFLLMEYLPGPSLAAALADPAGDPAAKDALFRRYLAAMSRRHAEALGRHDPGLIQEHPGLDHCLVSGGRLAVFDLETAYTPRIGAADAVAAELAGLVRSLFRALPEAGARHFLGRLAADYPDRGRLESVSGRLFRNPSPGRRLLHALDRLLFRKKGRLDKYAAARLLDVALAEGT
jgi:hypothetical protein